jgi:gamma-glutamyltranspeptidase/glutathione hydrolase
MIAGQLSLSIVQGDNNSIQPGKRPLSAMSPTIVTKEGNIFMVTGSPGGSRIITITLEAILNVIDHRMDIRTAIDTPRFHHQWMPDTIFVEDRAVTPEVRKELEADGYKFTDNRAWEAQKSSSSVSRTVSELSMGQMTTGVPRERPLATRHRRS